MSKILPRYLSWFMACAAICCLDINQLVAQSSWTEARQKSYLDDCAHTLAREFGTDQPRAVCQCMLESTVHRHPNPDELDREMENPEGGASKMSAFAREIIFPCLNTVHPSSWLKPMETQFRASCRENARIYLNEREVVPYCDCMEEQVKKAYPGSGDFAALSITNMDTELAQMGERCLERVLPPPGQH